MTKSLCTLGLTTALALTFTPAGFGQCQVFDLEGFAPGTVATSLIPGVTITCPPNSCSTEGGLILPEIYQLTGTPNGTTNVISTREGCPDFSPDHLLLTFDENQSFVQFRLGGDLGLSGLEIRVRWFNEFGTPLGTRVYDTASGMGLQVTIDDFPIRSVEIRNFGVVFENIDDLQFGQDTTRPVVEINTPTFDACVCGDSSVGIVGSVDDPDGVYDGDTAEYRPINADPSEPWTLFGSASGAFTGTLHTLSTTGLAAGRYYVRVTGTNECGLSQSDITVIRVDRSFGTLSLPGVVDPLCGVATIEGRISDSCGLTWTLDQRPVAGGGWVTIATGDSGVDCEIADWDTTAVADGEYELRLQGTDTCGHTDESIIEVVVDNSAGCGCTADINGDGVVDFTDLLLVIAQWTF